jgi:hypothetical protein
VILRVAVTQPTQQKAPCHAAEGVFAPEKVEVGSDEDSGLSAGSGLSWFTMGQKTGSSSLACLFHVQRRRIHHMHPVPAPGQWRGIGTQALPHPAAGGQRRLQPSPSSPIGLTNSSGGRR